MEIIWKHIKETLLDSHITVAHIPLTKIVLVLTIILEQNARIINIRAFNNNLDLYFDACQELNLAILALLEKEGRDTLHLEFRTYLERYKQTLERAGKSIN